MRTERRPNRVTGPKAPADPLEKYWSKRDFSVTAEPRGERGDTGPSRSFVIQKHAATRLHYDFRLELDGVLVSWAVPRGPSFDPSDKRMAIHVEDHPLSYGSFEGTIPPKQYGAGTVIVWDRGTWEPVGDPREGLASGKIPFHLYGQKLNGMWELIRIAKPGEKQDAWLWFKKRDEFARPKASYDVLTALPDSVITNPLKTPTTPEPGTTTNATMPGAKKAPLPTRLSPQLATLMSGVPTSGAWLYEIKFDGYRLMTRIEDGEPTLITRGGHDWSARMPALAVELKQLGIQSAWLDGEIVVLGADGAPDFNALQQQFDDPKAAHDIVYFLFDAPFFEGYDLRAASVRDRRRLLEALLKEKGTEHVRFSAAFDGDPTSILHSARRLNLKGVIAKRADARYVSGRTDTWLKLKWKQRQAFVIAGYTERSDGAAQIGSLLLGVNDATSTKGERGKSGKLVSVGSVGTGWSAAAAADLLVTLRKIEREKSPFENAPAGSRRWPKRRPSPEHWVEPCLVAEIEFPDWTPDAQIRHASYIALRTDKPMKSIVRETARTVAAPHPAALTRGIKVTHGDRVIDASTGTTKLTLIRYYESVSEWMLPHLTGRPCSLVRAPTGLSGQIFFQKHGEKIGIHGITELDPSFWPGHEALLEVSNAQALVGAAQMNVIEFHTWNSTVNSIDRPDRIIFDLDPGEGTTWREIQEAASLMQTMLDALELEAWLKTSGGKGLHVVVPITPKLEYEIVKNFSRAVVQHLAKTIPAKFVSKSGPANRKGKIFVDYLRNGHGATTAAAYSARARPGLGVSMPIAWDALPSVKSGAHWTVATAREYLSFVKVDPWAGYWMKRQSLTKAMKTLGFKPPPTSE